MTTTTCDRCGAKIVNFPEKAMRFPDINVTRNDVGYLCVPVDLCDECKKLVYEFIYGKSEGTD